MGFRLTFGPRKVINLGKRGAIIYIPMRYAEKLKGKTVSVTIEVIEE